MAEGGRAPRVLVLTTNFPRQRRGDVTGNFVVDPILALADDVEHVVLAPLDAGSATRREQLAEGVAVRRFGYWWPRSAQRLAYGHGIPTNLASSRLARLQLAPFLAVFATRALAAARDVDVVHAHWLPTVLAALPARLVLRRPLLVTLHGTDVNRFPRPFVRWALRRCDVVVSSHDDLLERVHALAPSVRRERIRHLVEPQPTDGAAMARIRSELGPGPVVIFVGRLSPERDPLTFVRSVPYVLERVPDARFAVVGDGVLRHAVLDEIRRLGVGEHVRVFGHRPDVWNFLALADVFAALSPLTNAWVTALVEAMRASVPAVVTDSGSTPAALTDGEDVLLVPVADPQRLGQALARVLLDPGLARRLAEGARRRLARAGFEPAEVRGRLLMLYRELAGGGPAVMRRDRVRAGTRHG